MTQIIDPDIDEGALFTLTLEELIVCIKSADPEAAAATKIIDWGHDPKAGKRSGKSVRGSMADPPRGKKEYTDPVGAFPDAEDREVALEVNSLSATALICYQKARVAGLDHDCAMLWSYTESGYLSQDEAFDLIQKRGLENASN